MKGFSLNIKSGGIIVIVVILLAEFMVLPWLAWVDDTRLAIKAQQSKLAKQERLIAKAIVLEEQRELLDTEFTAAIADLVVVKHKEDSAVVWLKEVESHLAKYDLKVNRKSPLREVSINEEFAVFAGKVNVTGDYSEVLNWLEKLENYKLGNRVRQLRLNSNKATPELVTADVEFLKVFKRL
tara:strand:- start:262 stop:807 length:546 start_codon:yes stop_codon:yes gene_type:complete